MEIAILLFQGLTTLDAVGPYEVLVRVPDAQVTFIGEERGLVTDEKGRLSLHAEATLEEMLHPDVVLVPGGPGQAKLMDNQPVLSWLQEAHKTTKWTTSVCTGSLVLGAAKILEGKKATSHWLALDELEKLGAVPVRERVVKDGKIMTAAGVSAGIDMALELAACMVGDEIAQAIQLGIEYDPHPPFNSGSPSSAPPNVVARLKASSRFNS